MDELARMHCVQVKADTPRLGEEEIRQLLAGLPGWNVHEIDGEARLEKVFKFANFSQAMAFTDRVAGQAEAEDHHPALLTEWGRVTVTWWTHRIGGLHRNDFIMAARSDSLYETSAR